MFQSHSKPDKAESADHNTLVQHGQQRRIGKPIGGPAFENHAEEKKDWNRDDHLGHYQPIGVDVLYETFCHINQKAELKTGAQCENISYQKVFMNLSETVSKNHYDSAKGHCQSRAFPEFQTISRNGKMRNETGKYGMGINHNGSSAGTRQIGSQIEADDLQREEETQQDK